VRRRLLIRPRAAADLEEIGDAISASSPAAAAKLLARFQDVSELLAERPQLGMARPEIAAGLRHFPVGNFLVLYREIEDGVEIVRYVDGRRRLEDLV
jgi:toxin ParE1/3/4